MAQRSAYFPDSYEGWLADALDLPMDGLATPPLCEALWRFQKTWAVGAPTERAAFAYTPDQVRAYTLFYMTINLGKLWFVLERSGRALERILAEREEATILDLGCGPGTLTWALLFYLRQRAPELLPRIKRIHGVDRQPDFLAVAGRLAGALRCQPELAHLEFVWEEADWHERLDQPATVVLLGNTLAEQPEPAPAARLATIPGELLVLLEPGTRDGFASLLPVRDAAIAAGRQINFPCPAAATCPMQADNWCHFHINRFHHPLVQRLAAKAGRLNPRHHFTAFILSRQPTVPPDAVRILSRLRRQNRSGIRWLCDGEHLVETVVNRRAKGSANRDFFAAEAGDLARLHLHTDRRRFLANGHLAPDDQVERVDD